VPEPVVESLFSWLSTTNRRLGLRVFCFLFAFLSSVGPQGVRDRPNERKQRKENKRRRTSSRRTLTRWLMFFYAPLKLVSINRHKIKEREFKRSVPRHRLTADQRSCLGEKVSHTWFLCWSSPTFSSTFSKDRKRESGPKAREGQQPHVSNNHPKDASGKEEVVGDHGIEIEKTLRFHGVVVRHWLLVPWRRAFVFLLVDAKESVSHGPG